MMDTDMKNEKRRRAVIAGAEIFLRYGYARTTMNDIAKAAAMSRPALYLLFPGKEQVFEAATQYMAEHRLQEIRDAIAPCVGLEEKLKHACQMLLVNVFELQITTPDARDMDDLVFQAVRDVYEKFENFFADIIQEYQPDLSESPHKIARVLLYGARGLGDVAKSADAFSDMIRLHVALLCRGLPQVSA